MKETDIPIKAKVLLSPLKLYSLFGQVPYRLIFHILIVLMDVLYLLTVIHNTNSFAAATKLKLFTKFLDPGIERDSSDQVINRERDFYNLTEFRE
jgi:cell division protein FtsW (lipid II flippase)